MSPRQAAPPPPRYRSGWCGTAQHGRCRGAYAGADCRCDCHLPAEVPTREERDEERSLPGVTPSPLPRACPTCGRPYADDEQAAAAPTRIEDLLTPEQRAELNADLRRIADTRRRRIGGGT